MGQFGSQKETSQAEFSFFNPRSHLASLFTLAINPEEARACISAVVGELYIYMCVCVWKITPYSSAVCSDFGVGDFTTARGERQSRGRKHPSCLNGVHVVAVVV